MPDELTWHLLTEVNGRLEADMLKSYLEAHGVEVELVQEAVGHNVYPVTIDGLGRVQLFVSDDWRETARRLLDEYNHSRESK